MFGFGERLEPNEVIIEVGFWSMIEEVCRYHLQIDEEIILVIVWSVEKKGEIGRAHV